MRRICALSSHNRNRNLLKSIRNMASPGLNLAAIYPALTIGRAALTNGCKERRPGERRDPYPVSSRSGASCNHDRQGLGVPAFAGTTEQSIPELLAQDSRVQARA